MRAGATVQVNVDSEDRVPVINYLILNACGRKCLEMITIEYI